MRIAMIPDASESAESECSCEQGMRKGRKWGYNELVARMSLR